MPQVLPKPVLQVEDFCVLYRFFILEQKLNQISICCLEVRFRSLYGASVDLDAVHLPGPSLGRLSQLSKCLTALIFSNSAGFLILILFEHFA